MIANGCNYFQQFHTHHTHNNDFRQTLHQDLWLPPQEDAFSIDCMTSDPIKTILALRTPVWPPVVSKVRYLFSC